MTSPPIFISFSSKDRKIAETLCGALENRGFPCWISYRDIHPGENFQEAIVAAIRSAATMLLVFTENANNSDEIKKEVALASQHKLLVIPLRVEDIAPRDAFAYELATRQWIDMIADWEGALDQLAARIGRALPARPAEAPAAPQPSTLPQPATSLIGRDTELAEIKVLLEQHRLVTLLGPGGIGKSRLALQAGLDLAARFPDGVRMLELAPVTDPALVAELLCGLLGVPATPGRAPAETAAGYLRQKRLLLILDNCEHLVAAAAELAEALLRHCPGIGILATSREVLAVPGEAVYRLPTLSIPPSSPGLSAAEALQFGAVRHFVERAAAALGRYALSDADAPAVAAICRQLDGLALAIELAAPRLKILRPAQLLEKLSDRFRVLTGGSRTVLPRQQTLRALIDWSYDLLSEAERSLLRRLAVFAAGWSIEGAVAVAAGDDIDEWDIIELMSGLVDKSLVMADTAAAEPRYRLLESTRHYALDKLRESGETGYRRRLADHMAAFYRLAEEDWPTASTEDWLQKHATEIDNLRSAIDWAFGPDGNPALGGALVARTDRIAGELSLMVERARWLALARRHLDEAAPEDVLRVELGTAKLDLIAARRTEIGVAALGPKSRAMVEQARRMNDPLLLGGALHNLASCLMQRGVLTDEARAAWEEAVSVLRSLGENKTLGAVLSGFGGATAISGDFTAARPLMEAGARIARRFGDRTGLTSCASNLAHLDFVEGHATQAIERAEEAIVEARRGGVKTWLCELCGNLVAYLMAENRTARAVAVAREGLELALALERHTLVAELASRLAMAALLDGAADQAARLRGFARSWQDRHGLPQQEEDARLADGLEQALFAAQLADLAAEGAAWTPDDVKRATAAHPGSDSSG